MDKVILQQRTKTLAIRIFKMEKLIQESKEIVAIFAAAIKTIKNKKN